MSATRLEPRTGGRKRAAVSRWIPWIFLFCGLLVLAYPSVAGYFEAQRHAAEIADYRGQDLTPEQRRAQQETIDEYNRALAGGRFNTGGDPFAGGGGGESTYFGAGQVLFIVHMPTIDVHVPVYYGTSDVILSRGAGLMANTNYPGTTGGLAAISAHRGMYNQPMFLHLDELKPGDPIYIETADTVLRYNKTGDRIVSPTEVDALLPQAGRDLLVLVTCDPPPLNTERLLVDAERGPITDAEIEAIKPGLVDAGGQGRLMDNPLIVMYPIIPILVIAGFVLGLRWLVLLLNRRRDGADAAAAKPRRAAD